MAENVTPVSLKIQGMDNREVMTVDYKFDRATDMEGQLAGIPRGGRINIRVKAMNDGNCQLLAWMLAESTPKDVTVEFLNTVDGKEMKKLEGKNCYCVNYTEKWEEGQDHYEEVEIVCQSLENGGAKFKNPWK